ncbi:lysophosphatidic acid receptor 6-like [Pholidichthys leucotaenia]
MANSTEEEANLVYAWVFGSILAIGLPLNVISLWILLRYHSLRSPNAVFMVNLAITDLLLISSLPMRVYFYATDTWPLGPVACISISMLFRNNIRSSSIFITVISVDRLLAVVYPLRTRHLRTASNAWKAAAVVWLFVLVVNIPEGRNFSKKHYSSNKSSCFNYSDSDCFKRKQSAFTYFQPVLVVLLLTVNIVCTAMVSWTLHSHFSGPARVKNKVKVMLVFAMNLVMFTLCFVPVSIGIVILCRSDLMPLVCLATANCCMDPLLYYFSFDAFWKNKEDVTRAQDVEL